MEDKGIRRLVQKAFEKAREEHANHSAHALANHIESRSNLSAKTLLRFHKKYVQGDGSARRPTASSIDELCRYLGYADYGDYVANIREAPRAGEAGLGAPQGGNRKSALMNYAPYLLALVLGAILWITIDIGPDKGGQQACMAWADSVYLTVSCDRGPYSPYGTEIIPLDPVRLKTFKKVGVDLTTEFFSQSGKPMIWYSRSKEGMEYFTAPGLHPITGKTLDEITEYIIDKYVPKHTLDPDSFLDPD